ncbi:outer membrane beta-barrel protein [Bradyrhizobium sediminis]|uniref:Outer membrane beta-barrel protein n=1 Tax=Bradyrhizobium sediminis TaxID=2840469 RepID=A0A975NSM9_9BRAD|nr:outer membrane beta-barrel protein [Bradyrhizobium sediminis]QWG20627.1 outer membrane beta-barrel protein [Bradyrhizobium sediminis]
MKKFALAAAAIFALFTGAASAADMAVKARPVVAPAPVFSWTGFYIGVHGGGAWFDKAWAAPLTPLNIAGGCPGCPISVGGHTGSSWLAGAQAGFNYQTGMWVLGVEVDGSWTDLRGSNANALAPALLRNNSETRAFATAAGRVGIAANRALFYVKGGGAWADDTFFVSSAAAPNVPLQLSDSTRWGWMVGVGVEYAFTNNWSVKAEYNHLDFGTHTETLQPQPNCACAAFQYDVRQTVDLVKVGLNYRFGWAGPVVAKY